MKFTRLFFTSILMCSLVGIATSCASQGPTIESRMTPGRLLDDRLLSQSLYKRLNQEFRQRNYRAQLELIVYNGRVFLLGSVTQESHKNLIGEIAEDFRHVKSVHNELHVGTLRDRANTTRDARIRTNARISLVNDPRTRAEEIKLYVHKGSVYLIGMVPRGVGDAAADLIKYIPNVNQVVVMLEYLD